MFCVRERDRCEWVSVVEWAGEKAIVNNNVIGGDMWPVCICPFEKPIMTTNNNKYDNISHLSVCNKIWFHGGAPPIK